MAIVASIVLWKFRGDFRFHWIVLLWLAGGFFIPFLRKTEKNFLHVVGKFNGAIILTIFYFVFFTPYSFLYRAFFRNKSFGKSNSTFVLKIDSPDFTRPF